MNRSRCRANFYVDGFNFYAGICDLKDKTLLWLDVARFARMCLHHPYEKLHKIKYFTAPPIGDAAQTNRHNMFMRLLKSLDTPVEIFDGKFKRIDVHCKICKLDFKRIVEKRTDVALGVQLVRDAYESDYDVAYIISGDTDLFPAIEIISKEFEGTYVKVLFPPFRETSELKNITDHCYKIMPEMLAKCRMKRRFRDFEGNRLTMPEKWINDSKVIYLPYFHHLYPVKK